MKVKTIRFRLSDCAQFDIALEQFCNEHKVADIKISNSDQMITAVVFYGEKDEPIRRKTTKAKAGKGEADGGKAQA